MILAMFIAREIDNCNLSRSGTARWLLRRRRGRWLSPAKEALEKIRSPRRRLRHRHGLRARDSTAALGHLALRVGFRFDIRRRV
jgi:hypothetical protein